MSKSMDPQQNEEFIEERDDAIIGVAFRWSLAAIVVLACIVAAVVYSLSGKEQEEITGPSELVGPEIRNTSQVEAPEVIFKDVTVSSGIDFVHENGALGQKLLPESMGGGCAIFDYDNDGDQDLLFVNSSFWPWDPRAADSPRPCALYRNDGQWKFTDVTKEVGFDKPLYGMGCAVGDYDNDGWVDLFVTAVGSNRLYKNQEGMFVDVTAAAKLAGDSNDWSTSAAWFDYDNDGKLDLVVCNYVRWSKDIDLAQDFQLEGVGRAYGPPTYFDGAFLCLYHNEGGGVFADASEESGVRIRNPATNVPRAKALGVSPIDVDRDGWLDLIIANDTVANFLMRNLGNGKFEEIAAEAGVADDTSGNPTGAMGSDAAFFRNNEHLGVVIGNYANEPTSLYLDEGGEMLFNDIAISTGLGPTTRKELTFGVCFFDYDLDGRLDIAAANGHLEVDINKVQQSQHYAQAAQLFWNTGGGDLPEFIKAPPERIGEEFSRPLVGRGVAFGDLDGDGDLDVVLTSLHGSPRVLENTLQRKNWLRIRLQGTRSNRDGIGALVVARKGDQTLTRRMMPTRGYLSQSECVVTLGLGDDTKLDSVEVVWPGGRRQKVEVLEWNTSIEVVEEAGE